MPTNIEPMVTDCGNRGQLALAQYTTSPDQPAGETGGPTSGPTAPPVPHGRENLDRSCGAGYSRRFGPATDRHPTVRSAPSATWSRAFVNPRAHLPPAPDVPPGDPGWL